MYIYAQSGKAAEGSWARGGGICHGLSGESGYALEEILSKEYEQIDGFTRPFGDGEVKSKFSQLLNDFKPDVVHLNNIHTQLSPLIAKLAHEYGAKVV